MSSLIETIDSYKRSPRVAFRSRQGSIDYRRLYEKSNKLAEMMCIGYPNGTPVIVRGHKEPEMLVAFLACAKSGRAFIPVDQNIPDRRLENIARQAGTRSALTVEDIRFALDQTSYTALPTWDGKTSRHVSGDDCFYTMFTSGSTGEPKGVRISLRNVESFVSWMVDTHQFHREVFINQAPFHFDLSVLELWCGLATESTIHAITKRQVSKPSTLFNWLRESQATVWVSTPSFANMCLAQSTFDEDMLPRLRKFLFCGETLTPQTSLSLLDRFPYAKVYNMYGPTETTCAVTSVEITREMAKDYDSLPVGRPKPGTRLLIRDEEVIILGEGVGLGYVGDDQSGFFEQSGSRAYATGDIGYIADTYVFIKGRRDSQVKVGGRRIDLGDVESNFRKVDGVVDAAAIVTPRGRLKVVLVLNGTEVDVVQESVKQYLPDYMVPSLIETVDALPLTANGKVDRSAL